MEYQPYVWYELKRLAQEALRLKGEVSLDEIKTWATGYGVELTERQALELILLL